MIGNAVKSPEKLVQSYLDEVDAGEGIGTYEKFMVDRYRHDLKHAAKRGYFFSKLHAELACDFFPTCLKHTAGKWAGEPFELLPWQCFLIWNLYGWRDASTKLRRFRKALVYVGRKNGKTQLMAGMALKELFGHPLEAKEPQGELYCTATKEEQAVRLWQAAYSMLTASYSQHVIDENFYIRGELNRARTGEMRILRGPNRGSWFKALGGDGKTQDSLSPIFVCRDELHEWRDSHLPLMEKLATASGARQSYLETTITTAGDDDSNILLDELEYCQNVVAAGARGKPIDDTVFAAIYKLEDDDDIFDAKNWRKANPALGVTPSIKFLEDICREAKLKPSMKRTVRRYHMNLTTSSFEKAFPPEVWERGNQPLEKMELDEYPACYVGLDMSKVNDLCSVAIILPKMIGTQWHYGVKVHSWACKGNRNIDYTMEPYATWIRDGHMSYSTDEIIDTTPIRIYLYELTNRYDVQVVYFDSMRCTEMATDLLNNHGMPMEDMPQTFARYEPAIKEFMEAIESGRVYHDGDPCLAWQANNAEWKYNHTEYRMVEKGMRKERKKVDAVSAMLMGMAAAIHGLATGQNDEVLVV